MIRHGITKKEVVILIAIVAVVYLMIAWLSREITVEEWNRRLEESKIQQEQKLKEEQSSFCPCFTTDDFPSENGAFNDYNCPTPVPPSQNEDSNDQTNQN